MSRNGEEAGELGSERRVQGRVPGGWAYLEHTLEVSSPGLLNGSLLPTEPPPSGPPAGSPSQCQACGV